MQRCTNELYWMDQQAEERINYDWSDTNLDYPARQRQYEVQTCSCTYPGCKWLYRFLTIVKRADWNYGMKLNLPLDQLTEPAAHNYLNVMSYFAPSYSSCDMSWINQFESLWTCMNFPADTAVACQTFTLFSQSDEKEQLGIPTICNSCCAIFLTLNKKNQWFSLLPQRAKESRRNLWL